MPRSTYASFLAGRSVKLDSSAQKQRWPLVPAGAWPAPELQQCIGVVTDIHTIAVAWLHAHTQSSTNAQRAGAGKWA